ncbi:putative disease resistance protein RGA3 [Durio zibethinus]|uniref:Disease resistance protein RGA3 n=1 Tax=Durio zibethinus TaxID=66656 RepID=A0A6P5ZDZ7_DURZI|nr:putative disease resistance protein RGA3 [Durio zibethinus]
MEVASLIVSPLLQVIYENMASYLSTVETSKDQKKNIKKLQEKLLIIQAVIEDAEERQLKDKNVKIWLSKLRDVAYDADNLLDEITTQVLRRQLVKGKGKMVMENPVKNKFRRIGASIYEETRKQVRVTSFTLKSILSSFEMSRRLTEIVERLDEIAREMSTFHFKEAVAYKRSDTMEKRETGSYLEELEVFGRTEDVKKIVDLLLSSDADSWVIPIVGIGGIGKTTLAQLIYNDQSLDGHFDKKIWVSLYDNFNTKKLLSEILECVTEQRCESSVMSVLQSQFRDSLYGKRYLLVMDDVWNDVQEEWDKVRNLLRCGAEGSKIIVTTRSEEVASAMSSTPPHHLEALTKDDCWTLFKLHAFAYGEEDS